MSPSVFSFFFLGFILLLCVSVCVCVCVTILIINVIMGASMMSTSFSGSLPLLSTLFVFYYTDFMANDICMYVYICVRRWAYNSWRVSLFNWPTQSAIYISRRSCMETSPPETARTISVCSATIFYNAVASFCLLVKSKPHTGTDFVPAMLRNKACQVVPF